MEDCKAVTILYICLQVTLDSDGNIQAMPDDLKDVEIDFDVVTDNVNNLARHLSKKRPKSKQTITFDPTTYERKLSASTFYVPLPDGYVCKYPVACQELKATRT